MPRLPDNSLSGAILSCIINQAWLDNQHDEASFMRAGDLLRIHALMENTAASLFGKIPESIFVPNDAYRVTYPDGREAQTGLERARLASSADMESRHSRFFDQPGFVLYDGVHASAFGHFQYAYRAKGTRVLWMRDASLRLCSVHATIDHNGFSLAHEEFEAWDLRAMDPNEVLTDIPNYTTDSDSSCNYIDEGDVHFWLRQLAGINQPYDRAYFMEYLLNPPDVQQLSDFSLSIRRGVWQSTFQFSEGALVSGITPEQRAFLQFVFAFLYRIEVDPPLGEVLHFVQAMLGRSEIPREEIALLLRDLSTRSVTKEQLEDALAPSRTDLIELKPNLAGVGINLNLVLNRLTEWWKRRSSRGG